jgi:phage replication-related protein YjqB (UPF0714/DUF867 family)
MNNRNLVLLVLLTVLLSFSILSEDSYGDMKDFDYVNSDYSTINDWSNVDWEKIPVHRVQDIPVEELDYSQLNVAQRFELSVEQIATNLDNIDNLAVDVKEDRALSAIKSNTGVTVLSLGKKAKIQNGVLQSDDGNFDFEQKTGWEITINDGGEIEILKPNEINEQLISSGDDFTVTENIKFTSLNGYITDIKDVSFKDGLAYVKKGDAANVGTYKIPVSDARVNLYFDPSSELSGNSVLITDQNLKIHSGNGEVVIVIPQPGNKLFGMLKQDHSTNPPKLVADERSSLKFEVSDGANVVVNSREGEGKTPLITHSNPEGEVKITTGQMAVRSIKSAREGMLIVPPKGLDFKETSVAFEFTSDYIIQKGKKKGTNFNSLIRTSSSNRFNYFKDGKLSAGNNIGLTVSDQIDVNLIKTIDDLKYKYPSIDFNLAVPPLIEESYAREDMLSLEDYTEISANAAQYFDQILTETPNLNGKVGKVDFNPFAYSAAGYGEIIIGEYSLSSGHYLSIPHKNTGGLMDVLPEEVIISPIFSEALKHQLEKEGDITYDHLLSLKKGEDYNILTRDGKSPVLIVAPHGGIIEPGSDLLASSIAGEDHNLYVFKANKQSCTDEGCRSLHVTSTKFKEPNLVEMAGSASTIVGIHAFGSINPVEAGEEVDKIIVGGQNKVLRDKIASNLRSQGFPVEVRYSGSFSGTSNKNLVNQPPDKGVQIEVSRASMRKLYEQSKDKDGNDILIKTAKSKDFSHAIKSAADDYVVTRDHVAVIN